MKRKLHKIGNSYGFIIPKNILLMMELDSKEDNVKIELHGEKLIITKNKIKQEEKAC